MGSPWVARTLSQCHPWSTLGCHPTQRPSMLLSLRGLINPVCVSTQLNTCCNRAQPTWSLIDTGGGYHLGATKWRGRRWHHSGGDNANGGGRAPTTVRLPIGHGGRNASSPELLIDGEEKKSGSATAFLRRGGATVASGGPTMVRREGRVSSTLHGRRTARGELGRRSPWSCSRWRRHPDRDGRGARTATIGFGPCDGAVGTSEARQLGEQRARGRCRGDGGAGEASCRDWEKFWKTSWR
jgi:hypothetical protein